MVVKSDTTSATTCGCIHWTYIFYSLRLEQAPGTEAHFSSEAALSTWWYPQHEGPEITKLAFFLAGFRDLARKASSSLKEMDRVGQHIVKTEPIAYEGSYECPICMESCRGENRVLSCARCPGARKLHAACFEGWGKKGCIQCGGAISEYTASSASSSSVASAPVVLLESDDEATTMEPAAKKAKTAAEVAIDAIKQLEEQLLAAERLQKELAAREAAARSEAQMSKEAMERIQAQLGVLRDQVETLTTENASQQLQQQLLQQQSQEIAAGAAFHLEISCRERLVPFFLGSFLGRHAGHKRCYARRRACVLVVACGVRGAIECVRTSRHPSVQDAGRQPDKACDGCGSSSGG